MLGIGRLHPLLLHVPIGAVLTAGLAEAMSAARRWRTGREVGVFNVRLGAVGGVATAIAGWQLAATPLVDPSATLELHRWAGTASAMLMVAAALASFGLADGSPRRLAVYRTALAAAVVLTAVTGHLGGTLVWGPDFLTP